MLRLAALFMEGALVLLSAQVVVATLSAPRRTRPARAGRSFSQADVPTEGAAAAVASY